MRKWRRIGASYPILDVQAGISLNSFHVVGDQPEIEAERVAATRGPILVTQRGRPVAFLVDYEDYEGLIATLDEISQPDWRDRLAAAERDSKAGKGIDLEEFKARRAKRGKKG